MISEIGEPPHGLSGGAHQVDAAAVAIRLEGDLFAVGRERGMVVVLGRVGSQVDRVLASYPLQEDVPVSRRPRGIDDRFPIGREAGKHLGSWLIGQSRGHGVLKGRRWLGAAAAQDLIGNPDYHEGEHGGPGSEQRASPETWTSGPRRHRIGRGPVQLRSKLSRGLEAIGGIVLQTPPDDALQLRWHFLGQLGRVVVEDGGSDLDV